MFFPILLVFLIGGTTGAVITAENPQVEKFIEHKVLQKDVDAK